ncbi:hypothetical protein D3C80_1592780 [compost metagenome]
MAKVAGAGNRGDIDDRALVLQLDHLCCHLTGAQEHAGQVHIDHRLPLGQAHLGHFPILDLHQQAIAQDTGVVDQAVNGTEVIGDLGNHMGNLLFVGYIAQVGPRFHAMCLAGGYSLFELFGVEVDQC